MTPRPSHDATLDEALDRRAAPRLRRSIALLLALGVALLLLAYGIRARARGAPPPGNAHARPPAARPVTGR